jgi:hypothetical protein
MINQNIDKKRNVVKGAMGNYVGVGVIWID